MKNLVQQAYQDYRNYIDSVDYIEDLCSQDPKTSRKAQTQADHLGRRVFYMVARMTQLTNPSLCEEVKRGRYDSWMNESASVCFLDSTFQIYPVGTHCTCCGKVHHREELKVPPINSDMWHDGAQVKVQTKDGKYHWRVGFKESSKSGVAYTHDDLCEDLSVVLGRHCEYLFGIKEEVEAC